MAKSGKFDKVFATGYTLRLLWEETAVNNSANTSTVKVTVQLITQSTYTINSSVNKDISLTCDNQSTIGAQVQINIGSNQTKTLLTDTFTVTHNTDGTKTAKISCTLDAEVTLGGTYYSSITVSGNAELTDIPKAPSAPTKCEAAVLNGRTDKNYVSIGESIGISWSGATGTITDYDVQRQIGSGSWKDFVSVTGTGAVDTLTSADVAAGNTVQYRVRANNGNLSSAWETSNKLTVMGSMLIKVNGTWKRANVWIKVNGTWQRAKSVWIKASGTWKSSK